MAFEKGQIGTFNNSYRLGYQQDQHPWVTKHNSAVPTTDYWVNKLNVDKSEIWVNDIPVTPPAVSTSVVQVSTLAVVADSYGAAALDPGVYADYVVVPVGGTDISTPEKDIINPAIYGDNYRPKLYRASAPGTYDVEIPYTHACEWWLQMGSGILKTFSNTLPDPFAVGEWRLECYQYVGDTLADYISSSGYINTVDDSGGAVTATSIDHLTFDDSYFTVTDNGGGQATVGVTSTVEQYGVVDHFTYAGGGGAALTVTLTTPTRVLTGSPGKHDTMLVYLNGVLQRFGPGFDYNISGTSPGPVTVTFLQNDHNLIAGDRMTVIY